MPGAAFGDAAAASGEQGAAYNTCLSPSKQYYANLTQLHDLTAEENENVPIDQQSWSLVFELVSCELMETISTKLTGDEQPNEKEKKRRRQELPLLPKNLPYSFLYIEKIDASKVAVAFSAYPKNISEGDWYLITLDSTAPNAIDSLWDTITGHTGGGAGGLTAFQPIKMIGSVISATLQNLLKTLFTVTSYFGLSTLENWLKPTKPVAGARGIGVMHVGIASCNLVYDAGGNPLVYFDVGLPNGQFQDTVPRTINPANGQPNNPYNPGPATDNNPIVILSHWHYDHYSMALLSTNLAALRGLRWLLPSGSTAASGHHLAGNIPGRMVFPLLFPGLQMSGFFLYPAQGLEINNNGIVMVVDVDYGLPNPSAHRLALLPGDATYQYFATGVIMPHLEWLVAVHHGSNTGLNLSEITPPTSAPGKIAYSYGIRPAQTYPHGLPSILAIHKYKARNWTTEASTAETKPRSGTIARGNIMMCSPVVPNPPNINSPFHVFQVAKQLI